MNQHPPLEISEADWLIIQAILRVHVPDYTVWTFGSRATGNAKKFSDLDLAIIGEQPMGLDLSSQLADAFSKSNLPYKVDLVDWAATSKAFKKIIERDKVFVQQGSA